MSVTRKEISALTVSIGKHVAQEIAPLRVEIEALRKRVAELEQQKSFRTRLNVVRGGAA